MDLPLIWFVLLAVLFTGYAVLDGFDLGSGILHFVVARDERERSTVLASIAPVWDGNEVWLLTAGGALFAAFPVVYATAFSGFYLALMLVLLCLIFRAVSLEVRGHDASPGWRRGWDVVFAVSSTVATLLFGVAVGNVLEGVPLDADGVYRGGLIGLLRPFPLLTGLVALAMFAMQGGTWLTLKTDGILRERSRRAALIASIAFGVLWVAETLAAFGMPRLRDLAAGTVAYAAPFTLAVAIVGVMSAASRRRDRWAFAASSVAIASLMVLAALATYPDLLPATEPARSLTIRNAASSDLTLGVMLVVALVGMPIVLAYTAYVYLRFRGVAGGGYGGGAVG